MKTYWVHVNFEVDAKDYDEAVEIAKAVRAYIEDGIGEGTGIGHGYKLRDVETPHGGIEEVG